MFLVETDRLAKPGQSTAPPFIRARKTQRVVEHFWLCDDCAEHWTLVFDPTNGISLAPLPRPTIGVAEAAVAKRVGAA